MDVKAFTQAYRDELKGLKEADKATINMLTMLAEDNKQHAQAIVETIELHLRECNPRARLPALYLMDSIIKNLKEPYISMFSKHIDLVFGRVWDSTMAKERERLSKLCKLWDGYLAPDVLARVRARMTASTTGQQAPAPVTVLQQPHPVLQQHAPPPQHMQPHVVQPPPVLQPHPGFPPHLQPMPAPHIVLMQPPPPQPQQGTVFVIGPHGQFVPVGPPPVPAPQLIPVQAIPQHLVAPGGLPPVSPAHPGWAQQQQQQLAPRPMQQQQHGRSPAYPPVSPALVSASPHHRTSPQHMSAPGSSVRSGSHEEQAAHIAASLDTLLQGLTRTGYLNDPALKTTSFDPAFIKVVLFVWVCCLCATKRVFFLNIAGQQTVSVSQPVRQFAGQQSVSVSQPVRQSHAACQRQLLHARSGRLGVCCSVQVMVVMQQCSDCVHVCSGSTSSLQLWCHGCAESAQASGERWDRVCVCEHTGSGRPAVAVRRCPRRCFCWRVCLDGEVLLVYVVFWVLPRTCWQGPRHTGDAAPSCTGRMVLCTNKMPQSRKHGWTCPAPIMQTRQNSNL